jgi:hypothetical protein
MPAKLIFAPEFVARISRMRRAVGDGASAIMPSLEKIAWEDNREGFLRGLDKDDIPFRALAERTIANRRSATGPADPFAPPLVPARERSRAIANYRVTSIREGASSWVILGAWMNVLSDRGVAFLGFHASGTRYLPVRDFLGVRPGGRKRISAALSAWLLSRWKSP